MLKYQKFQAQIPKMRCIVQKDQMFWFAKKPNEKLLIFELIFLWEVIYVHFYNWDRSLDLVPVVYNLIELIIETSLWSKDYFTFDTHPQYTRLCSNNAYVWLYMFKCDVYAQLLVDQTQKYFWVFYMFLKVILYFCVFKFLFKMLFCVFLQKLV